MDEKAQAVDCSKCSDGCTLPKTNMDTQNDGLKKVAPIY